ncbi:4'-phosphopantetheinyl transferase superfamily protein [Janibacter terrae]|uniref:4'-phosphopantetheinyl transferase superfamily protein n=1 Tax=Janibacter terrae TaxID=103817 RepID=A0ABZ2FCD9_9MICO|nr:4'-phosphopantetheinyl transferase superfamily protein [Janibacter terrae]MBA4084974.1 4-phosphopantetheinyl transferase [Kytococcus sp.]
MSVRVLVREAGVGHSPADLALLDPGEMSRAHRKRQPAPFVTGHALVRRVLGELVERDPAGLVLERRCTTCRSDLHGKPVLVEGDGWHFSLSYTPEVAVVAVAKGVEVGVDTEDLTDADFDSFARATLAREEVAGFDGLEGHELLVARARVWARKEAVLKATGHGLVVDPAEVLVSGPLEAALLVDWRATEPRPARISLADVTLDAASHRAAVAALTDEPLEVVTT